MFRPTSLAATLTAALCLATPGMAQEFITYTSTDSFENVAFAIESAIVAKGLVIDSISHVGEMLERTKTDVGATTTLFEAADVYQFCSALVSRQVMEADVMNFRFCPYGIYVFQMPGAAEVTVGHDAFAGSMAPVQDLLAGIVKEALELP